MLRELPTSAERVGGMKHANGKFRVKFAVKLLTEV